MIVESQEHRRCRSNSQSQVNAVSSFSGLRTDESPLVAERQKLPRRNPAEFYVTLASLNDTFSTKYIRVPFAPETCKLGRPTGAKAKPSSSNGYFDSRVLSRNHACMFVDPHSGKLYIQDMGSSNGTFVNLEKISTEPVQITSGDIINLGFNIQVETNHKQISARIEAVNVMANTPKSAVLMALPGLTQAVIDTFIDGEMKHYDFMLKFLSQIYGEEKKDIDHIEPPSANDSSSECNRSTAGSLMETAMFADLVPTVQSTSYRLKPDATELFDISYSPELQTSLDHLTRNLMKIKQQNVALKSLETVLVNYSKKVTKLNSEFLLREMEKSELIVTKIEKALQSETAQSAKFMQELECKFLEQLKVIAGLKEEAARLRADNDELALQCTLERQRNNLNSLLVPQALLSPQQSPPADPEVLEELKDFSVKNAKIEYFPENTVLTDDEHNLDIDHKESPNIYEKESPSTHDKNSLMMPFGVASDRLCQTPIPYDSHTHKPELRLKELNLCEIIFHPAVVSCATVAIVAGIAQQFYNK